MSSKRPAPTKRERARNEHALKELLKVSGNDRCADCSTMNPGWASWSVSSTSTFIDPDRRRSAHALGKKAGSVGNTDAGDLRYRLESSCARDAHRFIASLGRMFRKSSR